MYFTFNYAHLLTPTIAVIDTPDSLISERYRTIQANLKFLNSDKVVKTIVVTSAVPKEGKSTVSANLAAAIAQLDRKVLLIDADMRNPSQHRIWKLTNTVGLSEVLVGQSEFETAIDPVMDRLDVLTAGVKPLNPLALLDSKRMNSLVKDCSSQYDCVIIDAPSALSTADALTLSQMSDGILLVSRPGVVNHNNVMVVRELLEKTNHNILGLVVNGIIDRYEFSNPFAIEANEVIRDRDRLEQELAYEKEKQRMLNATLIGQRYNLQKNQEILSYYQDILSCRQAKEYEINKLQN